LVGSWPNDGQFCAMSGAAATVESTKPRTHRRARATFLASCSFLLLPNRYLELHVLCSSIQRYRTRPTNPTWKACRCNIERGCIGSRICPGHFAFLAIPISLRQSAECRPSRRVPRAFVQPYSWAQTYELISQFRLISSNCGVVHSMIFPPFTRCLDLPIPASSLQNSDQRTQGQSSVPQSFLAVFSKDFCRFQNLRGPHG
jgi:hypothetical protein